VAARRSFHWLVRPRATPINTPFRILWPLRFSSIGLQKSWISSPWCGQFVAAPSVCPIKDSWQFAKLIQPPTMRSLLLICLFAGCVQYGHANVVDYRQYSTWGQAIKSHCVDNLDCVYDEWLSPHESTRNDRIAIIDGKSLRVFGLGSVITLLTNYLWLVRTTGRSPAFVPNSIRLGPYSDPALCPSQSLECYVDIHSSYSFDHLTPAADSISEPGNVSRSAIWGDDLRRSEAIVNQSFHKMWMGDFIWN